jgi:DNA primase
MVDYVDKTQWSSTDVDQPQAKTVAADRVLPLIAALSDPVQQSHYLQRLGRHLQVSESALQQRLRSLRPGKERAIKSESPSVWAAC